MIFKVRFENYGIFLKEYDTYKPLGSDRHFFCSSFKIRIIDTQ